jgi:hypothetical protein
MVAHEKTEGPSSQASNLMMLLRPFVPKAVREFRKKIIANRAAQHALEVCAGLSVEQTFETVYKRNFWGGNAGEFYSGTGSDPEVAAPYCQMVREFIRSHNIRSIVDVGCGDFRVSRNLLVPGTSYLGVDVVPQLIERNNREFGTRDISFRVMNAVAQPLPGADLCLIRQVLQHLSNQQIRDIIGNCRGFRYLLVSDHLISNGLAHINTDKPHGPDKRAAGILLDQPPFNYKTTTLLNVPVARNEVIRTVLIEQQPA